MKLIYLLCITLLAGCAGRTTHTDTQASKPGLIYNGVPWYDDQGNIINAHGACIVQDNGRYYLFGEWKSDESNAFPGFSCYSSDDLVNWHFENVVLRVQPDGIMGPGRVGERVKVMKCPSTGEYVMYMHSDDLSYKDPYTAYATCSTIAGDYQLQGPLLYNGKPIKRWDMGTFQDTDGTGYLLIHHGPIYRLADDYKSIVAEAAHVKGMGESPALFKKNGTYYLLTSNLTSWEKNDNFYFTAPSISGPWTRQGTFCPEGTLTYNSQTTFVLPLRRGNDTIPMFMGDRWSYPHQASAATYVWMPMKAEGTSLSIPAYWPCWDIHTLKPVSPTEGWEVLPDDSLRITADWVQRDSLWCSRTAGETWQATFHGTQALLTGESNPHGGYARVSLTNQQGDTLHSSLVDFYSKCPDRGVRFLSPRLPQGTYTLTIEVTGERPNWTDKTRTLYGSDDTFVCIESIRTLQVRHRSAPK